VSEPLRVAWIHGAAGEPAIQAHWYDESTVILRGAKSLNYEAPFLFLLLGEERALLLDTAYGFPAQWRHRPTWTVVCGRSRRVPVHDGPPGRVRRRTAGDARARLPRRDDEANPRRGEGDGRPARRTPVRHFILYTEPGRVDDVVE